MIRLPRMLRLAMEIVGFAAILALLLFLLFPGIREGAGISFSRASQPAARIEFSPTDTITIVLTAATLVLAGVALIVSLLAVIGYAALKELAVNASRIKAEQVARTVAEQIARDVAGNVADKEVNERLDRADVVRVENESEAAGLSPQQGDEIAKASGNSP